MQAHKDVVQNLVLASLLLKLSESLEVGLVDTTIVGGGERDVGPNAGYALVNEILALHGKC
jgi:hypothetical protein